MAYFNSFTVSDAWEQVKTVRRTEFESVIEQIKKAAGEGKTEIEIECDTTIARMLKELGFRTSFPHNGLHDIYW